MNTHFDSRKWHIWVSIVLSIPILIVSVTAIFIAHDKDLALKDIPVSVSWLPGYRGEAARENYLQPRASLRSADGTELVATNGGLYEVRGDALIAVPEFAGVPVRALTETSWGLVAAARNGIWVARDGIWQRTHKGDAWNATARDGGVLVAMRDEGLLTSIDGQTWSPERSVMRAVVAAQANAPVETITAGKLVMDLHTGKAFFGKEWEWIWIDLVGLAMTLLSLTGVYMWWRGERRKRVVIAAEAPAKHAPTTTAPIAVGSTTTMLNPSPAGPSGHAGRIS